MEARDLAVLGQAMDNYLVQLPDSIIESHAKQIVKQSFPKLLLRIFLRWLVRVILTLGFLLLLSYVLWLLWL